MKKLLVIFPFILGWSFFTTFCFGQSMNIDSLLSLVEVESNNNEKFKLLDEVAWQLMPVDPNRSLYYAEKSYSLALESKNYLHQTTALNSIASVYKFLGKREKAINTFFRAYEIDKKYINKDESKEGVYLVNIGGIYAEQGKPDSAYLFLSKAKSIFSNKKDTVKLVNTLSNIGNYYYQISQSEKSITTLFKALDLADKIKANCTLKGAIFNNLGIAYDQLKQLNNSEKYYLLAKDCYKGTGHDLTISNNLGNLYLQYGQLEKAYTILVENLEKNDYDDYSKTFTLEKLGTCFKSKKEFKKAKEYFEKAHDLNLKIELPVKAGLDMAEIGYIEAEMGNFENAITKLKKAYNMFIEAKRYVNAGEVLLKIIYIELNKSKLEDIVLLVSEYDSLKQIVSNEANSKAISEAEIKYETEKKKQKITILNQEKQLEQAKADRNRKLSIAAFLLGLGILFIWYREKEYRKHIVKLREAESHTTTNSYIIITEVLEKQATVTENQTVKTTLEKAKNLVKTSAAIHSTIKAVEDDDTHNSQHFQEGFFKLIDNLKTFGSFKEEINVNVHCDSDIKINPKAVQSLFLLVDELFTNSVKHAFKDQSYPKINVSLTKDSKGLCLSYSDNGNGIPQHIDLTDKNNKALRIMKSLLPKLGGTFSTKNIDGLKYEFLFDRRQVLG